MDVIYTSLKNISLVGYNYLSRHYGSIFIHLAVVASQICKMSRKFKLIVVQSHPRSSTLVPIESAYACNFLLVISSNFGRISIVFEILRHIGARK